MTRFADYRCSRLKSGQKAFRGNPSQQGSATWQMAKTPILAQGPNDTKEAVLMES
jgi:hypothetical protein